MRNNIFLLFQIKKSVNINLLYIFSIVTFFHYSLALVIFPELLEEQNQILRYLKLLVIALCLIIFSQQLWLQQKFRKKLLPLLGDIFLYFCLSLLPTYIVFLSNYKLLSLINCIFSAVLLVFLTSPRLSLMFFIINIIFFHYGGSIAKNSSIYLNNESVIIYNISFTIMTILIFWYNNKYIKQEVSLSLEQKVLSYTRKLHNKLRDKKEFLDKVANEIRSPLHNITNIATELHDQWGILKSNSKKELTVMLKKSSQSLLKSLSNIIALPQDNALNISTHNIQQLIKESVLGFKNISIDFNYGKSKTMNVVAVECDNVQIKKVIISLLNNILEYDDNCRANIIVNILGKFIKITLHDNTNACKISKISKHGSAKIFASSGTSTEDAMQKDSLQLFVCKQVIEAHGGDIWTTSNDGLGKVLSFTIPINQNK